MLRGLEVRIIKLEARRKPAEGLFSPGVALLREAEASIAKAAGGRLKPGFVRPVGAIVGVGGEIRF